MGFGFVEVDSEEVAKGVIKKLQVIRQGRGGGVPGFILWWEVYI